MSGIGSFLSNLFGGGDEASTDAGPQGTQVSQPATAGIPEAEIAVIAAAAYMALGGGVRIVHVESPTGTIWAAGGRFMHHASHNVPHHPAKTT